MRYIDKSNPSQDFEHFVNHYKNALKNKKWKDLKKIGAKDGFPSGNEIKKILYEHLWKEQKGLCIYCGQELSEKLEADTGKGYAHIEHVKPKNKYHDLRFEQSNLSISCDGFDTRYKDPATEKEFCGHNKSSEYDEVLFLNPLEVENVEDFFEYDILGNISSHPNLDEDGKAKADYTIKTLNLDHSILIDMRKEQYEMILREYWTYETEEEQNQYIENLLNPDYETYPAFYSMLKQFFL